MLASSPVFEKKNVSGLTVSSDLTSHQKPLSKSNIQAKSMQFPSSEMQQQMAGLKQKAHQSFMQVIQMQQLHQQQVQQLRKQFQLKEESYRNQLNALELRIRQLEYQNMALEKNYRQHHCNIEENDLSIDNIQLISCKDESRLDESSISNFCQIISSESYQEKINSVRDELKSEFQAINTQNEEQKRKVEAMIDKLFQYVLHLKRQFISLQDVCLQTKRQLEQSENKNVNGQILNESYQKQTKFLGEQVTRLANEKMKGQRQILELQRKLKQIQRQNKKPESITRNAQKGDLLLKKNQSQQSKDHSIEMNQFIKKKLAKSAKQQHLLRGPMFSKKIKN